MDTPRWKRILKRVLIALGVMVGLLAITGFALYFYGGMSRSADPTMTAQYDRLVASGQATPIQKRFVIPIPGCVCHSNDPVQTAKHRTYRMRECSTCHSTNPPQDLPLN